VIARANSISKTTGKLCKARAVNTRCNVKNKQDDALIALGREQLESVRKWIEIEIRRAHQLHMDALNITPVDLRSITMASQQKHWLRHYRARLIRAEKYCVSQYGTVSGANIGRQNGN
jgi:hypothetical protein